MTVYRHPETGDRSVPAEPAFEELLKAQGYVPVEGDEASESEVERLRRENAELRKGNGSAKQEKPEKETKA